MDFTKLLSRSFEITRKFRALWLFGFLLALFSGSGGGGGGDGAGTRDGDAFPNIGGIDESVMLAIGIGVFCFALVLIILAVVLTTISRGALIGLVAEYEAKQMPPTVRRGFSIGAQRFWKMFGISIVVYAPLTLVGGIVLIVAALPLVGVLMPLISRGGRIFEEMIPQLFALGLGSLALLICVGLALVLVFFVLRPFYEMMLRECVIHQRGVRDSIREGFSLGRRNLGDLLLLYVLSIAIGIGAGIVLGVVGLILLAIPVAIGLAMGLVDATLGVIAGIVIGLPAVALIIFLHGLYQAFDHTLWTEGYLAIQAKASPAAVIAIRNTEDTEKNKKR